MPDPLDDVDGQALRDGCVDNQEIRVLVLTNLVCDLKKGWRLTLRDLITHESLPQ